MSTPMNTVWRQVQLEMYQEWKNNSDIPWCHADFSLYHVNVLWFKAQEPAKERERRDAQALLSCITVLNTHIGKLFIVALWDSSVQKHYSMTTFNWMRLILWYHKWIKIASFIELKTKTKYSSFKWFEYHMSAIQWEKESSPFGLSNFNNWSLFLKLLANISSFYMSSQFL